MGSPEPIESKEGSASASAPTAMALPTAESDGDHFLWTYTEEPHRTRRFAIIAAHPEVLKLVGPEPLTKYVVAFVVALQISCAYALRNTHPFSFTFFITAYVIGATANQNLFLAIHEISHNLAFRAGWANRVLAMFANLPIGIPYSATFRPYHLKHHKKLGVEGADADLPTKMEAILLDSLLGKAFFCTFQILFYAVRPMFTYRLPMTPMILGNMALQFLFDTILVSRFGWNSLIYLILSSFLAGSLHPCAGHFISEHYSFDAPVRGEKQDRSVAAPETYSYYGVLNYVIYNVGLHNEHHDFPAVPWTRLYKLNAIASEFYDPLPHHTSLVMTLWRFVMDPKVGLWCRVKRKEDEERLSGKKGEEKKEGEGVEKKGVTAARRDGWTAEEVGEE